MKTPIVIKQNTDADGNFILVSGELETKDYLFYNGRFAEMNSSYWVANPENVVIARSVGDSATPIVFVWTGSGHKRTANGNMYSIS